MLGNGEDKVKRKRKGDDNPLIVPGCIWVCVEESIAPVASNADRALQMAQAEQMKSQILATVSSDDLRDTMRDVLNALFVGESFKDSFSAGDVRELRDLRFVWRGCIKLIIASRKRNGGYTVRFYGVRA